MKWPSWLSGSKPATVEVYSAPKHELTLDMRRFTLDELRVAVYTTRFNARPAFEGFDFPAVLNHALYRVEQHRKAAKKMSRPRRKALPSSPMSDSEVSDG